MFSDEVGLPVTTLSLQVHKFYTPIRTPAIYILFCFLASVRQHAMLFGTMMCTRAWLLHMYCRVPTVGFTDDRFMSKKH